MVINFSNFLLSADKATGPEVPDIQDATDFAVTEATESIPEEESEDDDSTSTGVSHSINFNT